MPALVVKFDDKASQLVEMFQYANGCGSKQKAVNKLVLAFEDQIRQQFREKFKS